MANPYHDAAGKFCSKGEMKEAIEKLANENKLDAYFALRKEYEDIENGTVTVSQSVVQAVPSHNPAFANLTNPAEIRGVFEVIKDDQEKHAGNIVHVLANPHTPQDVKDEIARTASDKVRLAAMKKFDNPSDPATGEDIKALATNTKNVNILEYAVTSKKLTFEDRYTIAKTYDEGLNQLARSSRDVFFREPELAKEFRNKTKSLLSSNHSSAKAYLETMGRYSHDEESHQFVLDHSYRNGSRFTAVYELSENGSISLETGYKAIEQTQQDNIERYRGIYQNTVATMKGNPNNSPFRATPYPWGQPELFKGEAPAEQEAKLKLWKQDYNVHSDNTESLQAAIDSYADNNNRLRKNLKYLRRHPSETIDGADAKAIEKRLTYSERYREANYLTVNLKQRLFGENS